jgi:predicted PP-loop superfamily ATPase
MELIMKICKKCILPETFPGIKFNDQGICNHCLRAEASSVDADEKKSEYHDRLDQLIESVKGVSGSYDAIMAYSGGKDSSYALKLLRERYDLKILAFTFDNHFVSPGAWTNIDTIVDTLSVDLIKLRPPWSVVKNLFCVTSQEDIFSKATLLRASSICTACIGIVKSFALKTAIEMEIPLVAFGWSPGQAPIQSAIMKTNPALIKQNQESIKKAFSVDIYNSISQYFLPQEYFDSYKERFPTNIHPLAFFDYNESAIMEELKKMGWKAPDDTDTNSSNCLINAFANHCHIERHKFHPYVWEIANMVRQGVMDRDEGMEKIYTEQNQNMVEYAKKKLGI